MESIPKHSERRIIESVVFDRVEHMGGVFLLDAHMLEIGATAAACERPELGMEGFALVLECTASSSTLYCDARAYRAAAQQALTALLRSEELRTDLARRSAAFLLELRAMQSSLPTVPHAREQLLAAHQELQGMIRKNSLNFVEENLVSIFATALQDELRSLALTDLEIAALCYPQVLSSFQLYEQALLELGVRATSQPSSHATVAAVLNDYPREITQLAASFGWLNAGFNASPKSVTSIATDLLDLLSTGVDPRAILDERKRDIDAHAAERDALAAKYTRLSEGHRIRIELAQQITNQVQQRVEEVLKTLYVARPLYTAIAGALGISPTDMKFLTPDEVLESLRDSMTPPISVIKARQSGCAWLYLDGNATEIRSFKRVEAAPAQLLRGQVAYPGMVKGTVRIVHTIQDAAGITAEHVLVSSRTSPELVEAMSKACAILSEHGGMLCHAAIVSRELKKPCIVGVVHLLERLKNGDRIEVDAERGTISLVE